MPPELGPLYLDVLNFWGDPFAGRHEPDSKTVAIFKNVPWSIKLSSLHGLIIAQHRVDGTPSVRDIIRVPDDSPNAQNYKVVALLTDEETASDAVMILDGAVLDGVPIRVHLHTVSQRNDIIPAAPYPDPKPHYRVSSNDNSGSPLPESATTVFHKFQLLPAEIRVLIWKEYMSFRRRRIVQIEWCGWEKGFKSQVPIPVSLQINRESRFESQKKLGLTFASRIFKPRIRFSHSDDILYLTNSPEEGNIRQRTLRRFFDQVPQEDLNNIWTLSFDYSLWFTPRRADRPTAREFRTKLPSLELLGIVMSNGLRLDNNGSAGLDHQPLQFQIAYYSSLYTGNHAFCTLVEHIIRQFEEEAADFPEWKPPGITIVQVMRGGQYLQPDIDTKGIRP